MVVDNVFGPLCIRPSERRPPILMHCWGHRISDN